MRAGTPLLVALLPCTASFLATPALGPRANAIMSMSEEAPEVIVQADITLDENTVEVAAAAAAEVIDMPVDAWGSMGTKSTAPVQLERRDASSTSDRDATLVQHREAASFFDTLLEERDQASGAGEPTPMETKVKEKIRKMSFLQSELEYAVSSGLASKARKEWVEDKMVLEEQKCVCKQQWADLKARQQTTTHAFDELAAKVGGDAERAAPGSTALTLTSEWTTSTILTKTSLREQVALLEEHVTLSKRQAALDARDEALMQVALQLYEEEGPSRDRRAEILEQQQGLLTELQQLVQDTSAFNGNKLFNEDGFAEGLVY